MATVQLNITGHDQSGPSFKSATGNIQSLDNSVDRLTSRVSSLAGALGLLYVSNKLWEGFTLGIKAVDDFQQSVIKTSAMITSLQGGDNIAENYRLAKEYAEGLQNALMKVDSNTSLNLDNLQAITEEMVKQGVILDTNNADQIDGFTRLANAAAVYSNNGRNEVQLRQEVRALMMGQVDQNSQLAGMVQQMVKGPLQDQVNKWKESGTLMQELGKALSGFGPASKDMASTWSAVKSSLETSVSLIMRAGFGEIVEDIVEHVGTLNEYLKENKEMIGGEIKKGWEEFKSVAATVADVAKTIYDNFEPFAAIFIGGALIKGIGSTVSLMKDLLAVATAARAVMLTTGIISAGTAVTAAAGTAAATGGAATLYGAGAAAAGSFLPGAIGAGVGLLGAGAVGVGLGYASQPAVRYADKKLYQWTGLNLTGEAMYNEAEQKNQDADARWNAFKSGNPKYNTPGGSGVATPVIASKESDATYTARIQEQEKELSAYKAMQDSKTTIAKHAGEVELADLKQRYASGLVSTQEYYASEASISKDTAYEKYSNAVDYYNKEVDLLEQIGAKKGEQSAEYQSELAKNSKADEAVQTASLEMQKTAIESETKYQEQLRSTEQEYSKLIAQSQEAAGQYTEAAETKIAAEMKTAAYLRLSSESQALKEKEFSIQRAEASSKELEEAKKYSDAIKAQQNELDMLNGKTNALTDAEKSLKEGRNTSLDLQNRLNIAVASGNATAVSGLSQQISLQEQLNQKKTAQVQFEQQVGVLNGSIVGFSGDTPVYADAYQRELAANGYQSAAAAVAASNNSTSASSSFINNNAFPSSLNSPFLGGFAVGTNYIPSDGYAYLHKGEAVVPEKYNPAAGGTGAGTPSVTIGDIHVNLPAGTPDQNAKETARAIYSELRSMGLRFRQAA